MKKILIYVSLLYFENTFACSFGPVDLLSTQDDILMSNPEKAVVAFTGVIIREKRKPGYHLRSDIQFILPERKWTDFQTTKIVTSSICGRGQMTGVRYLFLSNDNDMNKDRILIELENAGEYISKLARKTDFVGDMNPAWQFCREHRECISIKNRCKTDVAINIEYKETYSRFLRSSKAYDCTKNISKSKPTLKCIDFFCS